jgi:hypothetical protein
MMQPCLVAGREQAIDTMIALTRLSNPHRAIVAGSQSMELLVSLRRRGFARISTPATYSGPRGQHSIALITAETSQAATEAVLAEVSRLLAANATIAILITSREGEFCLQIRKKLEQIGFSIEAGVRCQEGLVLSASRQGCCQKGCCQKGYCQSFARMEKAA